ncbi:uncharacterized protein RB166_008052 [Leptodactylus fuscus]
MECRLPEDKLVQLRREVQGACGRKKLRLQELQSLLGKLNFACRILAMGRVFCRRLAAATGGVRAPHHYVRLGRELRGDLKVWDRFLASYNGRSLMLEAAVTAGDLNLFTDASGSMGFGAFWDGRWCVGSWPEEWKERGWCKNLALLELFPIVVALSIWGEGFRNKKVKLFCDNMGVVQAINGLSASSPPVVCLLQHLVLLCLSLNAWVVAEHVPGVDNCIADALSRLQWDRFRELAPQAQEIGDPWPEALWELPFGRHSL